jgi:polyhydroxybutyrate depolymerase
VILGLLLTACSGVTSPVATSPQPTGTGTGPSSVPATSEAPAPASHLVPDRSAGCVAPRDPSLGHSAHVDEYLTSGGATRTYKRYVPGRYDASPAPLLVDLHGYLSAATGQATMSNFGAYAETAGFVVATPQGNSAMPYWNAVPHDSLPDDVQFISDVIDDVSAHLCVDPSRVYVDGLSNGRSSAR